MSCSATTRIVRTKISMTKQSRLRLWPERTSLRILNFKIFPSSSRQWSPTNMNLEDSLKKQRRKTRRMISITSQNSKRHRSSKRKYMLSLKGSDLTPICFHPCSKLRQSSLRSGARKETVPSKICKRLSVNTTSLLRVNKICRMKYWGRKGSQRWLWLQEVKWSTTWMKQKLYAKTFKGQSTIFRTRLSTLS